MCLQSNQIQSIYTNISTQTLTSFHHGVKINKFKIKILEYDTGGRDGGRRGKKRSSTSLLLSPRLLHNTKQQHNDRASIGKRRSKAWKRCGPAEQKRNKEWGYRLGEKNITSAFPLWLPPNKSCFLPSDWPPTLFYLTRLPGFVALCVPALFLSVTFRRRSTSASNISFLLDFISPFPTFSAYFFSFFI